MLGARLRDCCELILEHSGETPEGILGGIDALKLRSSMTLFHEVSDDPLFKRVLDAFYSGEPDLATLAILQGEQ